MTYENNSKQQKDNRTRIRTIISIRNKKLFTGVGAVIAVVAVMTMYYLLMPAWVIAIRIEYALPDIDSRFKITDRDLIELPSVREAIALADGNYPYDHWNPPVKASYLDGRKIVERFQMSASYPPEYEAILIYDGSDAKVYHVQVVFGYEQLAQQ